MRRPVKFKQSNLKAKNLNNESVPMSKDFDIFNLEPNTGMNRKQRRAAAKTEGQLDTMGFLKLADKFIDLANRENEKFKASDVQMAMLFAAARYNAHVAKNVLDVDNHEVFVKEMAEQYKDMLRQHLGDDSLDHPPPEDKKE